MEKQAPHIDVEKSIEYIKEMASRLQADTNKCVDAMTEQVNSEAFWAQMATKLSPKIDTSLGDDEAIIEQINRLADHVEERFGVVIDRDATIASYHEWKHPKETEETFMRKKLHSAGIYHKPSEKCTSKDYQRMMAKKKAKNRKKRRNK